MRSFLALLFGSVASAIVLNGTECVVNSGQAGLCIATASCTSGGGTFEAGHCPGSDDIKCCTWGSCTTGLGLPGECLPLGACNRQRYSSACPGPDNVQCCFGGPTDTVGWTYTPSSTSSSTRKSGTSTSTSKTTVTTTSTATSKSTTTTVKPSNGTTTTSSPRPPTTTAGAAKATPAMLSLGGVLAMLMLL